mmetsp:Transcript_37454/g.63772  ORF Transcript_37454/g.63772 Transcript_37454/m.63772 type:complete len:130 (-) Transcript_37454:124-513(-)
MIDGWNNEQCSLFWEGGGGWKRRSPILLTSGAHVQHFYFRSTQYFLNGSHKIRGQLCFGNDRTFTLTFFVNEILLLEGLLLSFLYLKDVFFAIFLAISRVVIFVLTLAGKTVCCFTSTSQHQIMKMLIS